MQLVLSIKLKCVNQFQFNKIKAKHYDTRMNNWYSVYYFDWNFRSKMILKNFVEFFRFSSFVLVEILIIRLKARNFLARIFFVHWEVKCKNPKFKLDPKQKKNSNEKLPDWDLYLLNMHLDPNASSHHLVHAHFISFDTFGLFSWKY